ncbi:flagellar hook protein FlgE [Pleomorphomonas diazotrophica]|uniref:Flagellar hook protein FlgE n=1 Tax=Pleomorphomonas diazotrophica TaxID=1166257 RepID=A0A1I4QEM9_9HYPH|nr:flagellar hook protein FlgE [Pleomorphomonas diazotrophica]PKR90715.1 flagellar hook protein FlgE [Pleomorphomonas diazotrophica]SFM38518.1 flagellar hook protein FlgE [Pleomorphomonas diazotrophica]
MSLYGVLRSGVSGMNAQGSRLATTADNIANANTVGYKRASTEFSSMVIGNSRSGAYQPAGVTTQTRYAIGEAGSYLSTTSGLDLAVTGSGFFVVQDAGGTPYLTRAGSFVEQTDGTLKNAGGFTLLGYDLANGPPSPSANSLTGLVPVNVDALGMTASPTTSGYLTATLDSNATASATPASGNTAASTYTNKTSLTAYDNLGNEVMLDVYFTKTGANQWEYAVFDRAGATGGGFPYVATGTPAVGPVLSTGTLNFNPANGNLTAPAIASFSVPNGGSSQTMTLDLSSMTQLGTKEFNPTGDTDGNAAQAVDSIEISDKGIVYAIFGDGTRKATFQIPLANVPSPDNLTPIAGNAYSISMDSGDPSLGFAGSSSFGVIKSGSLEQSNADMASELTAMIEAQRGYTANSKVFQTGSDLLDVLVNLKR